MSDIENVTDRTVQSSGYSTIELQPPHEPVLSEIDNHVSSSEYDSCIGASALSVVVSTVTSTVSDSTITSSVTTVETEEDELHHQPHEVASITTTAG
jgi:hypothetical protein